MKKYVISVLFIITALIVLSSFGDKTEKIKLENIKGTAVGSEEETPKQIRDKAISAAKLEALNKAGVSENINSFSDLYKVENSNKYEELFTSNILSNINGEVVDVEVINEQKTFTPEGATKITVIINCTVLKYNTKADLSFDAAVEGIEKFYKNDAGMIFTVKPTKDCYIRTFLASAQSPSQMIYPSEHEPNMLFLKDKVYTFPDQTKFENYNLTTEFKEESYRLIIVLLKEDIPFMEVNKPKKSFDKNDMGLLPEVSYKTVAEWINRIPPDQRQLKIFTFTVVK